MNFKDMVLILEYVAKEDGRWYLRKHLPGGKKGGRKFKNQPKKGYTTKQEALKALRRMAWHGGKKK